jgi:hypothetical protein
VQTIVAGIGKFETLIPCRQRPLVLVIAEGDDMFLVRLMCLDCCRSAILTTDDLQQVVSMVPELLLQLQNLHYS